MHLALGDRTPKTILCSTSDGGRGRKTLAHGGREVMWPGEAAAGRAGIVSGCFKGLYEFGVFHGFGRDQGFVASRCGCPVCLEINAVDTSVSWTPSSCLHVFTFPSKDGNLGQPPQHSLAPSPSLPRPWRL